MPTTASDANAIEFLAWRGGIFLFEKAWPLLRHGGKELTHLTTGDDEVDPFAERLLLLFQTLNLPDDFQTQRTLLRLESRLPNRFVDAARSCSFLGVFPSSMSLGLCSLLLKLNGLSVGSEQSLVTIKRWLNGNDIEDAEWFVDKATGDNLDRPEFQRLQSAVFNGEVKTVVVWKLDRFVEKADVP